MSVSLSRCESVLLMCLNGQGSSNIFLITPKLPINMSGMPVVSIDHPLGEKCVKLFRKSFKSENAFFQFLLYLKRLRTRLRIFCFDHKGAQKVLLD